VGSVKSVKLHSAPTPQILAFPLPGVGSEGAEGNNGISLTLLTTLTAKPDEPDFQQRLGLAAQGVR
jgi:hypothetical protein